MVLFTLLNTMRRKRTRSSPSSPSDSTDDDPSSSEDSTAESSSSPSSSSSSSSSSEASDDERPLRNSRSNAKRKDVSQRRLSLMKPPRKKLKTVHVNGTKLKRGKSMESASIEKVKKPQTAPPGFNKQKRPSIDTHASKSENLNPTKQNGNSKALKETASNKSSSTSKSATVARQSSVASSSDTVAQAKAKIKNGYAKSDSSRSGGRKTDPEAIYRIFDKPSQIYQCLALRHRECPIILKRNLSYMTPKNRIHKQVPKTDRFKLPARLVANPMVLKDMSNSVIPVIAGKTTGPKSPSGRASLSSPSKGKQHQIDPKNYNLNIALCQVVGMTPDMQHTVRSRKSLSSTSNSASRKDKPVFSIDMVINRSYVGKNLETKSQQDVIQSELKVDFTRTSSDADDKFFENANPNMFDKGVNAPKAVSIDGSMLYPPNGYTEGKVSILIRANAEGSGWSYHIDLAVSLNRDRILENGLYSANFKLLNGSDDYLGSNGPRLLFAVCWSPAHDTFTCQEVFEQLRKDIVRIPHSPKKLIKSASLPSQTTPQAMPQQSASSPALSSPSRSATSRSRIVRVVFWLSDPSAGGNGIPASVANPFRCPWCHTTCPNFLSLLRHLRCWHLRLSFLLQAERVARVADITVTINKRYNHAEEFRHPPTLVADVPLLGRTEPTKRLVNTQIVWFSGKGKHRRNFHKASSTALAEFRRPESDLHPSSMIMIAGHLRTYYHSTTCMPLTPEDLAEECDSDAEEQPWLTEQCWRLLNEFTDVNAGEKVMMNMWNRFMYREKFFAQRAIFPACLAFVDEFGPEIAANGLMGNFRLHLTCLAQSGLLNATQFYAVMVRLQRRLDDGKKLMTADPVASSSSTSNTSSVDQRPTRKSVSSTT